MSVSAGYGRTSKGKRSSCYLEDATARNKVASFLCVRPTQTFHVVRVRDGGIVTGIEPVTESEVWINGGFFLFKREVFDYLQEGEDHLVNEPFDRLIRDDQLLAHRYTGFWTAMDTFKDRERLEDMWSAGKAPWVMWVRLLPGAARSHGKAP